MTFALDGKSDPYFVLLRKKDGSRCYKSSVFMKGLGGRWDFEKDPLKISCSLGDIFILQFFDKDLLCTASFSQLFAVLSSS